MRKTHMTSTIPCGFLDVIRMYAEKQGVKKADVFREMVQEYFDLSKLVIEVSNQHTGRKKGDFVTTSVWLNDELLESIKLLTKTNATAKSVSEFFRNAMIYGTFKVLSELEKEDDRS